MSYLESPSYILIPGAGGMAWYWHRVVALLEQAQREAIAVDLPGGDEARVSTTMLRSWSGKSDSGQTAPSLLNHLERSPRLSSAIGCLSASLFSSMRCFPCRARPLGIANHSVSRQLDFLFLQ